MGEMCHERWPRGSGYRSGRGLAGGAGVLAALALATGCAVGPDYTRPEPALPDAWHIDLTRGLAAGDADLQRWGTTLEDPELDSLVERASAANLDLRQADAAKAHGEIPATPVLYITQLLGLALGLSPRELGVDALTVSADSVLSTAGIATGGTS